MHIRTVRVPAPEAGEFEDNLLTEGFVHVMKDPEELAPKEFIKHVAGESEEFVAADFIFIWKE